MIFVTERSVFFLVLLPSTSGERTCCAGRGGGAGSGHVGRSQGSAQVRFMNWRSNRGAIQNGDFIVPGSR